MVLFFDQAEAIGLDSPSLDILICSCFKPAETILFVQWSRKLETGHLLKFPVNCPDGELAQFLQQRLPWKLQPPSSSQPLSIHLVEQKRTAELGHGNNKQRVRDLPT